MRRLLRDVAEGRELGDTTTLADPARGRGDPRPGRGVAPGGLTVSPDAAAPRSISASTIRVDDSTTAGVALPAPQQAVERGHVRAGHAQEVVVPAGHVVRRLHLVDRRQHPSKPARIDRRVQLELDDGRQPDAQRGRIHHRVVAARSRPTVRGAGRDRRSPWPKADLVAELAEADPTPWPRSMPRIARSMRSIAGVVHDNDPYPAVVSPERAAIFR